MSSGSQNSLGQLVKNKIGR